jgi:cytochrome b561
LAIVILRRLGWRWSKGVQLPNPDRSVPRILGRLMHGTLYMALIVTVALGLLNAWVRGDSLFGLFRLPKLVLDDKALVEQIGSILGLCANTLLILVGVHAAAALWHLYVLKDGVLARMIPTLASARAGFRTLI